MQSLKDAVGLKLACQRPLKVSNGTHKREMLKYQPSQNLEAVMKPKDSFFRSFMSEYLGASGSTDEEHDHSEHNLKLFRNLFWGLRRVAVLLR